jgi:cell division protein FtsL
MVYSFENRSLFSISYEKNLLLLLFKTFIGSKKTIYIIFVAHHIMVRVGTILYPIMYYTVSDIVKLKLTITMQDEG